jgi:hypothetical protein
LLAKAAAAARNLSRRRGWFMPVTITLGAGPKILC